MSTFTGYRVPGYSVSVGVLFEVRDKRDGGGVVRASCGQREWGERCGSDDQSKDATYGEDEEANKKVSKAD